MDAYFINLSVLFSRTVVYGSPGGDSGHVGGVEEVWSCPVEGSVAARYTNGQVSPR